MLTQEQMMAAVDPQDRETIVTLFGFPKDDRVVPPTGKSGGGGWSGRGGDDACAFVSVSLSAYQDGELDSDSLRIVLSHLSRCPHCVSELDALQTADESLEREWRDSAPLPSSCQFKLSVDAIMDALPPAVDAPKAFAPRRVHARARWTRFAAGAAGMFAFGTLLWSSYRLGYQQGQQKSALPASANPNASPASQLFPVSFFSMTARPAASSHFPTVSSHLSFVPLRQQRTEQP